MNNSACGSIKCKSRSESGILGGAISLTVSTVIVKLLGLIYKVPIARLLGDVGMGYFNSAYTVYSVFFILCTAGVPKAVMINLLDKSATEEDKSKIVRVTMSAFLLLGALLTVTFVAFSSTLADLIGSSESRYTMLAIAPSILFISISGVLRGLLSAEMKLASIAVSQVLEGVGKLVLGLIFAYYAVSQGMSLQIASAFTILGVTFGSLLGFVYLLLSSRSHMLMPKTTVKYSFIKRIDVIKRILSVSLPITLGATVMSMSSIIDLAFIMQRLCDAGYTETEATALFGNYTTLAVPMLNLVIAVVTPISTAFLPVFIRFASRREGELLKSSVKSSLGLTALVSAPMVFGILMYSKEILSLIFGSEGVHDGSLLLEILIPGSIFMSVLLITNSLLEALGDVKAPVYSMMVGCAFKLIITYLAVGNESLGISGAPIGTVVLYAVALTVSSHRLARRHKIILPIFSTHIVPYMNALISVAASKKIFSMVLSWKNESIALLFAIIFSALIYAALSLFCGTISSKKIKMMANYTKIKG